MVFAMTNPDDSTERPPPYGGLTDQIARVAADEFAALLPAARKVDLLAWVHDVMFSAMSAQPRNPPTYAQQFDKGAAAVSSRLGIDTKLAAKLCRLAAAAFPRRAAPAKVSS